MNEQTTTETAETAEKTRTRNVLSSEHKDWVKAFVRRQMTFFFGSDRIGEEVSGKIVKDVIANVGQFSDYNSTHKITELDAIAGLQKRILRSLGVHFDDVEIKIGAQSVLNKMEERCAASKSE